MIQKNPRTSDVDKWNNLSEDERVDICLPIWEDRNEWGYNIDKPAHHTTVAKRRSSCDSCNHQTDVDGGSYCNLIASRSGTIQFLDDDLLRTPKLDCPVRAKGFSNNFKDNPSVSLVIACLNEGSDLEATIATVLAANTKPDEILLVDDGSVEPCNHRVAQMIAYANVDFKYIRHTKRMGSSVSKNVGCAKSYGDVVIVVDSHMRFPLNWLDMMLADLRENPTSIIAAASIPMDSISKCRVLAGTDWTYDDDTANYKLRWSLSHIRANAPYRQPGLMGACYGMTRDTLDWLEGYAPGLTGYGIEEEWLSYRAHLLGIGIRFSRQCKVEHKYSRTPNRLDCQGTQPPMWEMYWNRLVLMWGISGFPPEPNAGYFDNMLDALSTNGDKTMSDQLIKCVEENFLNIREMMYRLNAKVNRIDPERRKHINKEQFEEV